MGEAPAFELRVKKQRPLVHYSYPFPVIVDLDLPLGEHGPNRARSRVCQAVQTRPVDLYRSETIDGYSSVSGQQSYCVCNREKVPLTTCTFCTQSRPDTGQL